MKAGRLTLAMLGAGVLYAAPLSAQQRSPSFTLPPPPTGTLQAPSFNSKPDVSSDAPPPDAAFAAFQRGYFVTALREATKRLESNANDPPAMTLIAELYRSGLGVRRDLAEAARWYRLASDRGDPQAMFALGRAYLEGAGVATDAKQARLFFEKAAERNHPGALYNLGIMETDGAVANFVKAAEFFRRASTGGDNDATYALAMFYREGTGVEKDRKQGAALLKIAADENNIAAQVEYAIALFNGDGVDKDETAAGKYFLKAAARENPIAQNRIARMYASGRGVRLNMIEAMKWHILARSAGVNDDFLDGLLPTLSPTQRGAVEEAVRKFVGN